MEYPYVGPDNFIDNGLVDGVGEAARYGHINLLEYFIGKGFSLWPFEGDSITQAAVRGAVQRGDTSVL